MKFAVDVKVAYASLIKIKSTFLVFISKGVINSLKWQWPLQHRKHPCNFLAEGVFIYIIHTNFYQRVCFKMFMKAKLISVSRYDFVIK